MNNTSSQELSRDELVALIRRVFDPRPDDTGIAFLVDLPDRQVPDVTSWSARRRMAHAWAGELRDCELGLPVRVFGYRNARTNNGDFPDKAWELEEVADDADGLGPADAVELESVLGGHSIVLAPTYFSATAPLKLTCPRYGCRAATMPGFTPEMIPALRLDYEEVNRRVELLKEVLDEASGAEFFFEVEGRALELHLDLRFRTARASGGLMREPGEASNLPSGETFVVPYEGERTGEISLSDGTLPVELDGEVIFYKIRENRAIAVEDGGPVADRERQLLSREPAYGNLAELGLGVLADFGVKPMGEILLDEKLGLHIAFGRSDHFGGQVGAGDFSRPEAVVHIDRVYLPETQPRVRVRRVDLTIDGEVRPLMREGAYVKSIFGSLA